LDIPERARRKDYRKKDISSRQLSAGVEARRFHLVCAFHRNLYKESQRNCISSMRLERDDITNAAH
jgi:hypothetical protein